MTDLQEVPQAFVRYARKVSPKQYETAEASISIPVTVPESGVTDEFLKDVEKAFNEAVLNVSAVLGLGVNVADDGTVQEMATVEAKIAEAFPGAQKAIQQRVTAPSSDGVPTSCPKCGGGLWDNRADKRNPRSPDLKCKSKACAHPIWLDSKF